MRKTLRPDHSRLEQAAKSQQAAKSENFAVAAVLQEIGLLVRLTSGDKFRARAYATAAESIAASGADLHALVEQHRLTELSGVGASLARVIEEIVRTGRSGMLAKLRDGLPAGVLELSRLRGLNLDKIKLLNEQLGVANVDDLKAAIEGGKLRSVRGFGARTEASLLAQISHEEEPVDRMLLVDALKIGERVIEYIRRGPNVIYVDQAGSARRWKETASQVRITAGVSKDQQALITHFLNYPLVADVESKSGTAATVRLMEGARVTLRVARRQDYWSLLHHETGSAAYLKKLAGVAADKRMQLGPTKMRPADGGKAFKIEAERDIYSRLGLQYVPPELREEPGGIEQALSHSIPDDLITAGDIKGMVHCHSTYSDGRNTIEQMASAAEAMGMKYITITDHSPTAHYAGGLSLDRLKRQWDEIDRVQEKLSIKLLRGTESDIRRDGSLDYPDSILEKFDVIIASIHQRYKLDESEMTRRVITAMNNPFFKIWGHPSGRLVQRRPPISARMEEILDAIGERGAAIEISGDPYRLDMEPRWTVEARKRGLKFVISTDAHSISDLENLRFGIGLARRAAVRRGEVLNTLGGKAFREAVKPA